MTHRNTVVLLILLLGLLLLACRPFAGDENNVAHDDQKNELLKAQAADDTQIESLFQINRELGLQMTLLQTQLERILIN